MKKLLHPLSALLLILQTPAPFANESESPLEQKTTVAWHQDEMGQFVFFAVLEGLYRDGVDNEVVDAIIGLTPNKDDQVKTHFVFRCGLCHATYEAFKTYRQRPDFVNAKGANTFGKGIDPAIIKELQDEDARTRVYAMGRLVRPWIAHRIEETRKTADEKTAMREELEAFARDGAKKLSTLRREKDSFYVDWNFYGSCQACEAAKDLGNAGF